MKKVILTLAFIVIGVNIYATPPSIVSDNFQESSVVVIDDFQENTLSNEFIEIQFDVLKCYMRICRIIDGVKYCGEWFEVPCDTVIEKKVE